jgi:hypothetical protein
MAVELHKKYLLGDLVLEPKTRSLSKAGVPVHNRKPLGPAVSGQRHDPGLAANCWSSSGKGMTFMTRP